MLSVPEILAEPQITERGFIGTIGGETSKGAALRVTRPGFSLSTPFPRPDLPPELGADTARWLTDIGMAEQEITA